MPPRRTIPGRTITVTAACDPRAASPRARTKAGTLRKPARQWRDGLAWSTKLIALEAGASLRPPVAVTVHSYLSRDDVGILHAPTDWFEGIAEAVGAGLSVAPTDLQVVAGRAGYAPPYAPSHFKLVVSGLVQAPSGHSEITCRACGVAWVLDSDGDAPDQCPHCGHEGGGLPFLLGVE